VNVLKTQPDGAGTDRFISEIVPFVDKAATPPEMKSWEITV
jgi:hypothetical protein